MSILNQHGVDITSQQIFEPNYVDQYGYPIVSPFSKSTDTGYKFELDPFPFLYKDLNPFLYGFYSHIQVFNTDFTPSQRAWLDKVFPNLDRSNSHFLIIYNENDKEKYEHIVFDLTRGYRTVNIKTVTHQGVVYSLVRQINKL